MACRVAWTCLSAAQMSVDAMRKERGRWSKKLEAKKNPALAGRLDEGGCTIDSFSRRPSNKMNQSTIQLTVG